eukprot:gene5184-10367_t
MLGLEGLKAFWALFWNKKFAGCLQPLVDTLSMWGTVHLLLDEVNLFVRARVEKLIAACGKTISDIPLVSLTTASGCVALINRAGLLSGMRYGKTKSLSCLAGKKFRADIRAGGSRSREGGSNNTHSAVLSVDRLSFLLVRVLLVLCSLAEQYFSRRFDSFDAASRRIADGHQRNPLPENGGDAGSRPFSGDELLQREKKQMMAVLSRSIVKGTNLRVVSGLRKRKEFLFYHVEAKVRRLVVYIGVFFEAGIRGKQIVAYMGQVRTMFSLNGENVYWFDNDLVRRARCEVDELREVVEKRGEDEKYPVTLNIVMGCREALWDPRIWIRSSK